MTVASQPSPAAPVAAPSPTSDWMTLTLRLVRWELFQAWRRVMAKVLLGILIAGFVLEYLALVLAYVGISANADPAQAANSIRNLFTFPVSVALAEGYTSFMGVVMLCILAGTVVGGEYGYGTQRLALSRGIGRGQALAAKVMTLAILAGAVTAMMFVLSALLGYTIGPALGGSPDGLSVAGIAQLLGYWAAAALRLFAYSLVALFFATLGRSTAAGIGGALGFVIVEVVGLFIVTGIVVAAMAMKLAGQAVPSYVNTLTTIRAAFLQTNVDALAGAARQGPLNLQLAPASSQAQALLPASPSALQALVVIVLWCAATIGFSYVLVRVRDVTD